MKKLNSQSRHIYQNMGVSSQKLKRNLTKEESLFNRLLKDWLLDLQARSVVPDQEIIYSQCGLFKIQAGKMARQASTLGEEMAVHDRVVEALSDLKDKKASPNVVAKALEGIDGVSFDEDRLNHAISGIDLSRGVNPDEVAGVVTGLWGEAVDWEQIGEALESIHFEFSSKIIEETRTVRLKVTGMISVGPMNNATAETLRDALGGDLFWEYETVSYVACSVERTKELKTKDIDAVERYLIALTRGHVLSAYKDEVVSPDRSVVKSIIGEKPMPLVSRAIAKARLIYL